MAVKKNDKALVAAERGTELQQTESRIAALKKNSQWDLPQAGNKALRDKSLDEWIAKKVHQSDIATVELGFGFTLKKAQLPHGMFEPWIKSTGYSSSMVQKSMKVAQMVLGLPEAKAERVPLLPTRKQIALAQMPAAIRDTFLEEFSNDDIAQMSVEDMAEYKRLQKENANLRANLEAAQHKLSSAKKTKGPSYPNSVVELRAESSALTEQAIACVQSIHADVKTLMSGADLSTNRAERAQQMRAGIAPAYSNLLALAAELDHVIIFIEQSFDEAMLPTRAEDLELLGPGEIMEFIVNRDLMLSSLHAEKNARQQTRAAKGQTKAARGRPVKKGSTS